jgi:hypothetical protein
MKILVNQAQENQIKSIASALGLDLKVNKGIIEVDDNAINRQLSDIERKATSPIKFLFKERARPVIDYLRNFL